MSLEADYRQKWKESINLAAVTDPDSKLGTYNRINPDLKPYSAPKGMLEGERKLLTRFRTGSHSLAVELGRFKNVLRPNRLCKCKVGVQTVWHIFIDCPLTYPIHRRRFNNLHEVFEDHDIINLLLKITSLLKINVGN